MGVKYFFFEFFDEKWKDDLYGGVEAHWGLFYQKCVSRPLRPQVLIALPPVKHSRASPSPTVQFKVRISIAKCILVYSSQLVETATIGLLRVFMELFSFSVMPRPLKIASPARDARTLCSHDRLRGPYTALVFVPLTDPGPALFFPLA